MTPKFRVIACALLLVAATGCESLQRKFTRKPKHPLARPSPIIKFQDYSQAITPEERYRKHYMMFDYWNHELMDGLQGRPLNPKRYRKASEDSLAELNALMGLLEDEPAAKLAPLIEERTRIVRRLVGSFSEMQADGLVRELEAQARALHRDFAPGDVKDALKDVPPPTEAAAAAEGSAGSPTTDRPEADADGGTQPDIDAMPKEAEADAGSH